MWSVLLLGAVVWTAVALLVAVVVGRGIRLADEREALALTRRLGQPRRV